MTSSLFDGFDPLPYSIVTFLSKTLRAAINLFITKLIQISPLFNDQSPKNENNKTI